MLPTETDNGGRLAAILPTGLLALAQGLGQGSDAVLNHLGVADIIPSDVLSGVESQLPKIRSLVVIAVDGLGSANLRARAGHAPVLSSLPTRRITTVTPSTTAAALTTLMTGKLPGTHGLVGYTIRHPKFGLISPLRDWEGIDEVRDWQHSVPLFVAAQELGAATRTYGRPAHANGGLTEAILVPSTYVGGARITDRFTAAKRDIVSTPNPLFAYIYIDELDRAGHTYGWESGAWSTRLEQLDDALADFLTGLPEDVGVVLTADHGMVDVASHQQVVFDLTAPEFGEVAYVGGDPRFRSFYLREGSDPQGFADELLAREHKRSWVTTRDEVLESGVLGESVPSEIAQRLGDVILAARGQCAYYTTDDSQGARDMVGQHGSWTDEERGVPLILAGAFAGSSFARANETLSGFMS